MAGRIAGRMNPAPLPAAVPRPFWLVEAARAKPAPSTAWAGHSPAMARNLPGEISPVGIKDMDPERRPAPTRSRNSTFRDLHEATGAVAVRVSRRIVFVGDCQVEALAALPRADLAVKLYRAAVE